MRESGADGIRQLLAASDGVFCSRLTVVETRRVVRRSERESRINAAQAADLLSIFARTASTWVIVELTPEVARRAEEAFPHEPVRTLDAIHLASALFVRQSFPDLVIASRDERVRSNAAQLGLELDPV